MFNYNDIEIDALKEFVGIGIGRAADSLNLMLQSHIELSVSSIDLLSGSDALENSSPGINDINSVIEMDYSGNIDGSSCMIITKKDSFKLVKLLTEDIGISDSLDEDELDAIKTGTLAEIGNIVLNSIMGMISNILKMELSYTVPRYIETSIKTLYETILSPDIKEKTIIKAGSKFLVRDSHVNGEITIFLSTSTFITLNKLIKEYLRELSE